MTGSGFFCDLCRVNTKRDAREGIAEHIRSLSNERRIVLDAQIATHITQLSFWERAHTVFAYLAMADEVDLEAVFRAATGAGKRIALPRIESDDDQMRFHRVESDVRPTERHGLGFLQPPRSAPSVTPDAGALLLVPGRVFDRAGRRVGRGGGFYDRYLATLADGVVTVGIGYAAQLVHSVPTHEGDQAVQIVVTDSETCFCRRPETLKTN